MGCRSTIARLAPPLALLAQLAVVRPLHAQTESELQAARELFQDAYRDEQERRFPSALEKFERVARTKETPAVRYRIATVLEAMGRLREARDVFRAIAGGAAPADAEIAASAADNAAALDRKIPKLTVVVERATPDARLLVDGAPVPVGRRTSFELDPGVHVLAATRGTHVIEERKIELAPGAEARHTVSFAEPRRDDAGAIVALGTGGALLVTSAVLLAVREGLVSDVKDRCPGNVCPEAARADVTADRDHAKTLQPLAIGLGLGGLAAAGVGLYLLLRHPSSGAANVSRLVPTRGLVLRF